MDYDNDDFFAFYPLVNCGCAGRDGCRRAPCTRQYRLFRPPAATLSVKTAFTWLKTMAVRWKRLLKNITSGSALLQANPGVDPYVPRAGSVLTIPLQTILPDAPRQGIVINLAELRLYYYPPGKYEVTVYPIGIGQLGAIR